tara:strand:+ start:1527 stop:2132 length:606 start_codon:yes stop_codon:yes gene_type:complete
MADRFSYRQLLEDSIEIDLLLKDSEIPDEDKEELRYIWGSLKSRKESKFDAIIGVIKDCDKRIDQLDKEIRDLKNNKEHWKNKRNDIINIIKFAYENQLISSKPTGNKYQATIKSVQSKLTPNFEEWTDEEKKEFGLQKVTTIKALNNKGKVIHYQSEELPDKEKLRETLEQDPDNSPAAATLTKRVSLLYRLRKRMNIGI